MLLPTTITIIPIAMATTMILTTMIETGNRTMTIRGILGTEHHRRLASVKRTPTTGMATTPGLMIIEQGMIILTIQITLMMLDMVGMVRITAMMIITPWEEATLLYMYMVNLHHVMVQHLFVMNTACLLLELRIMTPMTPMDTITLTPTTTTTKGLMIQDMEDIIPLPLAAGVLMVVSIPQIPYMICTINLLLTSTTLVYNSCLNQVTIATPTHLSNRSHCPIIPMKSSILQKLRPLVDR